MNELGIIGIIIGAISLFLFGKQHEKKQTAKRVEKHKETVDKKIEEIKDEVSKSDLESLVASNNERFKGK